MTFYIDKMNMDNFYKDDMNMEDIDDIQMDDNNHEDFIKVDQTRTMTI